MYRSTMWRFILWELSDEFIMYFMSVSTLPAVKKLGLIDRNSVLSKI